MVALSHGQKVRRLYKTILRLHRGLPEGLRNLGDEYAKLEFKAHKSVDPSFVAPFMSEWSRYAVDLSKQLGLKGAHLTRPLGADINEPMIDLFTKEQLGQLYELYEEAQGKKSQNHSSVDTR